MKREKEEEARLEKLQDKEMIERIVEKERQLVEYERFMRQQDKEEARRVLASVKDRGAEMAAYERELDRIIEEERLRR